MMSGHGANPIFFNKKKKDWASRILATQPTHLRPITSHFCVIPHPLKLGVTCVSSLISFVLNMPIYAHHYSMLNSILPKWCSDTLTSDMKMSPVPLLN